MKNVITRALGVAETVLPDIDKIDISGGDIIMICSDGVSNMLEKSDIIAAVMQNNATDASRILCESALNAGGKDDLTAIVIKF